MRACVDASLASSSSSSTRSDPSPRVPTSLIIRRRDRGERPVRIPRLRPVSRTRSRRHRRPRRRGVGGGGGGGESVEKR